MIRGMLIILEVRYIKRVISDTDHYLIPGTDYYISIHGDVYNTKRQSYVAKEGNTVRLNLRGKQSRYNCDKLLIEALLAHISDIRHLI